MIFSPRFLAKILPIARLGCLGMVLAMGGSLAQAAIRPHYSLRYLAIEADAVVEAIPAAPLQSNPALPFTVTRTLKGALAVGARFSVADWDVEGKKYGAWRNSNAAQSPVQATSALLFLARDRHEGAVRWRLISSGVRVLTADKEILRPQQMMNPGNYHLFPIPKADWNAMIQDVQSDVAEADAVRKLRLIPDPSQRNETLLKWIEAHRHEFSSFWRYAGARFEEPVHLGTFEGRPIDDGIGPEWDAIKAKSPKGWAELEAEVFDWVMQSGVTSDAVRALRLYVAVHGTSYWRTDRNEIIAPFANPQGRKILLDIALDERESVAMRRAALQQMSGSLWLTKERSRAWARLESAEQEQLIGALLPFFSHPDLTLRRAMIDTVMALSDDNSANTYQVTDLAVPSLQTALAGETNAYLRDRIKENIERIKTNLKSKSQLEKPL